MNSEPIPFPKDLLNSFETSRLVILLETQPFSNVYQQVMLNQEQFKKVSDAISEVLPKCTDPKHPHQSNKECLVVPQNNIFPVKLPVQLETFYPQAEIDKET